jgi:hypothetical protein
MFWNGRISGLAALATAAVFPLSGCDGSDPVAPQDGTVEAVVRDDPGPAGGPALTSHEGSISGEFEATARVQVFVDGQWQDLSGLANVDTRTEIRGGEGAMGSASVEARTYERVRIVLTNARAEVDGSSHIGLGPIGVDVTVQIGGGGEVVVEHNQPVTVNAGATTRLVLQLNSHLWLNDAAVMGQAVARSDFESAAVISVQ